MLDWPTGAVKLGRFDLHDRLAPLFDIRLADDIVLRGKALDKALTLLDDPVGTFGADGLMLVRFGSPDFYGFMIHYGAENMREWRFLSKIIDSCIVFA